MATTWSRRSRAARHRRERKCSGNFEVRKPHASATINGSTPTQVVDCTTCRATSAKKPTCRQSFQKNQPKSPLVGPPGASKWTTPNRGDHFGITKSHTEAQRKNHR